MIKINIDGKKEEIEKIFWDWFSKNHLTEFLKILDEDLNLINLIFNDKNKYLSWIKSVSKSKKADYIELKEFFFSLPESHYQYVNKMTGVAIGDDAKSFFDRRYKNFRKSQIPKIIHVLDIHSCPYCNRSFLDVYYKDDEKGQKPSRYNGDMDHYFPKEKYPFLELCLYNLIPSCKVCNQEKMDKDKECEKPFHPYMDDHTGMYRFTTNFDLNEINIDYLYGLSEKFDIEIVDYFGGECKGNMRGSIDIFHLDERYKKMTSYAKTIIRKAYMYNNGYLKDFAQQYSDILTEKEIIGIIFDYQGEDFVNKPLSKLKYDLMKEFDII